MIISAQMALIVIWGEQRRKHPRCKILSIFFWKKKEYCTSSDCRQSVSRGSTLSGLECHSGARHLLDGEMDFTSHISVYSLSLSPTVSYHHFGNIEFEGVYVRVTQACYKHNMMRIMEINDTSFMFHVWLLSLSVIWCLQCLHWLPESTFQKPNNAKYHHSQTWIKGH